MRSDISKRVYRPSGQPFDSSPEGVQIGYQNLSPAGPRQGEARHEQSVPCGQLMRRKHTGKDSYSGNPYAQPVGWVGSSRIGPMPRQGGGTAARTHQSVAGRSTPAKG